jgi:outer membrane protein OmpA-like peptidoglycan-associated protein
VQGRDTAFSVTLGPDCAVRAAGTVPAGFPLRDLARRVRGIDLTAATASPKARTTEAATRLLDALTVILPRLAEGEIRIAGEAVTVTGRLRPGFNAEALRAAVRLALGNGWRTAVDAAEAPPAAALSVTWSPRRRVARGILPAGLAPDEALALLGGPQDGGLTSGGGGEAGAWRTALARLGALLPAYRQATAEIAPGVLAVEGALLPGHEAARLAGWLATALGEGWEVRLAGTETLAAEGGNRLDPVTGGPQQLVRGRWLPLHHFPPTPGNCSLRSGAILAEAPLRFVAGKAWLAADAAEGFDRLAGLARHCLNTGGLRLEIGGHTDSRGEAAINAALSEKRAMTVLLELVARGVRADAMRAVGHGERRAIAGNDSAEGRARNRRISFAWSG